MPLCPTRSLPPAELSTGGPVDGRASLVWNGHTWGVAWSEVVSEQPTVFFALVRPDGLRRGSPTRVSDVGYRGTSPAVAWDGHQWLITFSGGAGRFQEIFLARLNEHATLLARAEHVTARERNDVSPAIALSPDGPTIAWAAEFLSHRWAIRAVRLNRWAMQIGPPVTIVERSEPLGSVTIVPNDRGVAVSWLVRRGEAVVDVMRLDPGGGPHGYFGRATPSTIGSADHAARYALAWDGTQYGFAWDEVRTGSPRVFFHTLTRRLDASGATMTVSHGGGSARAPAIVAIAPGRFVAAWEVERDTDRHVEVGAIDGATGRDAVGVQLRGHDGTAWSPAMGMGQDSVGVATTTARGIALHIVPLGSCALRDAGR